jgi:hypothetical protein
VAFSEEITNHLIFYSNARYILDFLKSGTGGDASPSLFSLNTIKKMPEALSLPLDEPIRLLAIMNMAMPSLDERATRVASARLFRDRPGRKSEAEIMDAIEAARRSLAEPAAQDGPVRASHPADRRRDHFENAVSNYRRHRFFCQYDWRFAHWGTVEDVLAVDAATFRLPTDRIAFTTRWTPPLPAMQALASIFPSVRFELKYRYQPDEAWTKLEIFPNPPFGY